MNYSRCLNSGMCLLGFRLQRGETAGLLQSTIQKLQTSTADYTFVLCDMMLPTTTELKALTNNAETALYNSI